MAALSVYSLWESDYYTGRSRGRQDNDGTSDYCKTDQRRADFSCYGYNDENKKKNEVMKLIVGTMV